MSKTAKQSSKKPTAIKQPRKAATPVRAKKPAPARKLSPKVKAQAKTPLSEQPDVLQAANLLPPTSIRVTSVPQASALYGSLSKSEARKVRRQFYASGRQDLAAAPRSVSQLLP